MKGKQSPKGILRTTQHSLFHVIKTHVPHILAIIIVCTTSLYNIHSRTVYAEDFGTDTPMYHINQDTEEIIFETALTPEELASLTTTNPDTAFLTEQSAFFSDGIDDISLDVTNDFWIEEQIILPSDEIRIRDAVEKYTVQDGDTISSIAQKFGITASTILWENNLDARSIIRPGDTLTILPISGIQYTVKKNDTLGSIAKRYNLDEQTIKTMNRLGESSSINVGQKLLLPGARPPAAPAQRRPQQPPTIPRPAASNAESNSNGYVWPTPGRKINQYFSWRHTGLDIDNIGLNDPIYASQSGTIERSGWGGDYGNHVVIAHADGSRTVYGHLKTTYVKVGDTVQQGDVLGIMGTTGRSTGVHLHFEIRINGKRVNPLSYL